MSRAAISAASRNGAASASTDGRSSTRPRCRRSSRRRTASIGSDMRAPLPCPHRDGRRRYSQSTLAVMRIRFAVLAVCLMSAAACSGPRPASPAATPPETATASPAPAPSATAGADWPMYHRTPDHAGVPPAMPAAGRLALVTLDQAGRRRVRLPDRGRRRDRRGDRERLRLRASTRAAGSSGTSRSAARHRPRSGRAATSIRSASPAPRSTARRPGTCTSSRSTTGRSGTT